MIIKLKKNFNRGAMKQVAFAEPFITGSIL